MGEIVLSGIRATARLHFGNFLGAVRNFVAFQQPGNTCLYFVADWHTLTTLENPDELRSNLLEIVKDYLAAGLDPERSILYAQSSVPEIAELALYLSMIQPMGNLQNIPTFKELIRQNPDSVNLGMLSYPVLMAADILGPQSTLVPVGSDQIPNVELAQLLARRFNDRFGSIFTVPKMMTSMVKVPGLDGGKMSKSHGAGAIDIDSPLDEIRALYLQKAVTDPRRVRLSDPGDPYNGCVAVYPLHEIVTDDEQRTRTIANRCLAGSIGCRECKNHLVDGIAKILEPFQERRAQLRNQDAFVRDVLEEGGRRARARIRPTVERVRDVMGITRYGSV
ncbi:MAG: tryptophan--tRNA ligase [Candidatus Pacebacteria bacterium]|nr:tryptophan--tRNA ligase [Candidatus Paceibacterota bacterium]